MSNYWNLKRITELIVENIDHDHDPEQQKELAEWLKNPQNRNLYRTIMNSANFSSWKETRQAVDLQSAWDVFEDALKKGNRRLLIRNAVKYAAVILVALVIGGSAYFYFPRNPEVQRVAQTPEMHPTSIKAKLILNNGRSLMLDSVSSRTLTENDGTLIENVSGRLNYTKSPADKVSKKDKILYNTINTPRGGEYKLVLSDGTRVFLNAMSAFRYPVHFKGSTREVELLSGEAYFEVSHDPGHLFIVKTPEMRMSVLGTSFNVNAYENTGEVITTLVEGKLMVKVNNQSVEQQVLEPSDQAVFNLSSGSMQVNKVEVNIYTAWRNGKLIFYRERLEDIMNALSRWYSVKVFYLNPSVQELRFSGSINRYSDIRQILNIIQSTNKVIIDINKEAIVFSEKQ